MCARTVGLFAFVVLQDACFPVGLNGKLRIRSAPRFGYCAVMKTLIGVVAIALSLLTSFSVHAQQNATGANVQVRAGIKHDDFDRLLKRYVNGQGLVDYTGWKQNAADLSALDDYLKQFAPSPQPPASGNERAASLVNAYNAFVLQWILKNYPTESIWQLKNSFKEKRHEIGGGKYALNDIENGALRPTIGWRAHAVLVCAARSCPPLQRSAYTAEKFEEQDAAAFRAWLGRDDLNKFLPEQKRVEISSIFKWFKGDFDKAGGVPKVFGMYAPQDVRAFAASGAYETKYLPYNWGLNDQGPHGRNYTKANLIFDFLK